MPCLRWPAWRWAVVLAVPAVLGACSAGGSGALASGSAAASCGSASGKWTAVQPASPGTGNNDLAGVAVLAAGNAWAVGTYADADSGDAQTLVEHWDGTGWSVVPSPDPGRRPHYYSGDYLTAVSALSPSAIWAVGDYESAGRTKTLILYWNGTAWSQVASPSPGSADNELSGVWAISAKDVWAVGEDDNGPPAGNSLILHWNGKRWTQVPSPDPAYTNQLEAVTATSATSAWAVGMASSQTARAASPLILHWNGTAWTQAAAPHLQGTRGELFGVDATSAGDVWAAGDVSDSTGQQTLILHWNGTAWTRVPSPSPGSSRNFDSLHGVAAASAANAWATGNTSNGPSTQSLILHWNGTAWTRAASPDPGGRGNLAAIAESSPGNAWAIGQDLGPGADNPVAIRYCAPAGKAG
jgi:hypothetical protein